MPSTCLVIEKHVGGSLLLTALAFHSKPGLPTFTVVSVSFLLLHLSDL